MLKSSKQKHKSFTILRRENKKNPQISYHKGEAGIASSQASCRESIEYSAICVNDSNLALPHPSSSHYSLLPFSSLFVAVFQLLSSFPVPLPAFQYMFATSWPPWEGTGVANGARIHSQSEKNSAPRLVAISTGVYLSCGLVIA